MSVLLEGVLLWHRVASCIYNLLAAKSLFIRRLFNLNDLMNNDLEIWSKAVVVHLTSNPVIFLDG
jgi:hypothetical protein